MKVTVTESIFREYFRESECKDNFSHEGLGLLFEHLENDESNTEMELDPVALSQDYSELTLREFAYEYDITVSWEFEFSYEGIISPTDEEIDDLLEDEIEEYLSEKSILIGFTDESVVFQRF